MMETQKLYARDYLSQLRRGGGTNIKVRCPFCDGQRSDKKDRSLSINRQTLEYFCHYCNAKGKLITEMEELERHTISQRPRAYRKPVKPKYYDEVPSDIAEWFAGRGISTKTIKDMKVTKEVARINGNNTGCIAFNYFLDGEHVNTKYRSRDKHFTQVGGAREVPYNIDSICPSAYKEDERRVCIITEGEMDALTYIECGFKHVISVPNGANSAGCFDDFIESHFDHLETIYVSSDSDTKGVALKNELLRRFGRENCMVVEYPEGCKDINEVVQKHGKDKVRECFANAVEIRIEGIRELSDEEQMLDYVFENGLQKGETLGIDHIDQYLSYKTGLLYVYTGIPSHGKTFWLDFTMVRLNMTAKWKTAFFSPEFYPVSNHIAQIIETLGGRRFGKNNYTRQVYDAMKEYVADNFFWIDPDDTDINSVLSRAKYLVRKKGIKALVIDPFNSLTDKERVTQRQDEYISDFLQKLRWFARKNDIAVFLVMHPTKQFKGENKLYPVVDLYACKGASEIFDKADVGVTVWRNELADYAKVVVTKIKFRHLGEKGEACFKFNINNGRYVALGYNFDNSTPDTQNVEWDNSNYVTDMMNDVRQQSLDFRHIHGEFDDYSSDLPY